MPGASRAWMLLALATGHAGAQPKTPPAQVRLGKNCRAMVYGHALRPGVPLKEISLETLSQDAIIGLMGVTIMNPAPGAGQTRTRR